MTKGNKSLKKNAFLNAIRTFLNMIFPLITFPYVSRVLAVEGIGKYNFASSVVQYFLMIAALGISTYAVREGAKIRDDQSKFTSFSSEIFSINIISTIVSYVLFILCIFLVPKFHLYTLVLIIFSIEIIFTTIGTEWVFTIYEDYSYITIRSIIFKLLSILLLFLFVNDENDYIVYAGITVLANSGSNALNFFRAKKVCSFNVTFCFEWKKHMIPIMIIFASTVATTIYVNSDTTMLGFMLTDYEVGIYSVSSKIYKIVKQMLAAILIVSIPRLSLLMGQNRMKEYKKTLTKIFNVLVILVFPAIVGLIMLCEEIIALISGVEYIQASSSLCLLSLALLFCILGWIYNQCVLIPAQKEKVVMIATIVSSVANITINFFLIPIWKENAAAFSTIIAEAIMMIICIYYGRKITRLEKGVISNLVTVICACMVVIFICLVIKGFNLSNTLTLLMSISFSVIGYGCLLVLFRNKTVLTYLTRMFASLSTLKKN